MTEQVITEFNESLQRCMRREGFLATFYERFMGASDEIAALFARTDMARQRMLLKSSLFMCAAAATEYAPGEAHLREMGRRHDDYGVRPEHYDIWLNTLIEVASEYDPNFGLETAAAWETVMRRGVELLKEGHFQNVA